MHTASGHTQAFGDLRDTPIGLDGDTRRAVIDELQGVLADHLALYLTYLKHHWTEPKSSTNPSVEAIAACARQG